MALEAWSNADHDYGDGLPAVVLTFFVSLRAFQQCFENHMMVRCNHQVGGYRIYQDPEMREVDPDIKVHPVEMWEDRSMWEDPTDAAAAGSGGG